jgi:hypothetical protein
LEINDELDVRTNTFFRSRRAAAKLAAVIGIGP